MDKLESLIVKLNHVTHIIPPIMVIPHRITSSSKRGKKQGQQRIVSWHRQDLQIWIKILQWVTANGFPINNIVFNAPAVTLWSDSCEYGLG